MGQRELLRVKGIESVRTEVLQKLCTIADRLNIDPDHISAVIAHESGWNPKARNPNASASGLIQFMAATAKGLGTTIEAIREMDALEQLDWVEKYFKPFAGKIKSPGDALMATFWPAGVGKGQDYVIAREGSNVYSVNKGFDKAGKGYIDAADVTRNITSVVNAAKSKERVLIPWPPKTGSAVKGALILCTLWGAYEVLKRIA